MKYEAKTAEQAHLLTTGQRHGGGGADGSQDEGPGFSETMILTGDDLEALAKAMDTIAEEKGAGFFHRDAGCVRKSGAVVLLGIGRHCRGLDQLCGYCGLGGCKACAEAGVTCAFDATDLGIAAGSAAAVAEDNRVDTRIMFSVGVGAKKLGLFPVGTELVYGLPLSVSGKSPYFDR